METMKTHNIRLQIPVLDNTGTTTYLDIVPGMLFEGRDQPQYQYMFLCFLSETGKYKFFVHKKNNRETIGCVSIEWNTISMNMRYMNRSCRSLSMFLDRMNDQNDIRFTPYGNLF